MDSDKAKSQESMKLVENGLTLPEQATVKKKYSFDEAKDDSKMPLCERQSSVRKSQSMMNMGRNIQVSVFSFIIHVFNLKLARGNSVCPLQPVQAGHGLHYLLFSQ